MIGVAKRSRPRFEGYEVLELLNRGNTMEVYDAWSLERDCRVIVKTPLDDRLGDRSAVAGLLREGELLQRLTHPHIVRAYETVAEPRPAVVMETLGGETVAHMARDGGEPLSCEEIAQLGLQLCSAIGYLHRQGYLHLDLKPSNVIAESGRARLIDLGLARPPGELAEGIGTWCYMSPEQARGGRVSAAADVWGIGAVLSEAVTGWPPFDEPSGWNEVTDEEIPYPQLERAARRVDEVRDVGAELTDLIAACLRPEPAERPALPQLRGALQAVAGTATIAP